MKEINNYIEHTLLKPDATEAELKKLFDEAVAYKFLGVCVNPVNVRFAKEYLNGSNVKIVTVVGFPLGASRSDVKAFETAKAIEDGADEVDMVLNITAMKDKKYSLVQSDLEAVVAAAGAIPVKVILETDLLTSDEIKQASLICAKSGASFVKTSTGFVKNGAGAKAPDVRVMYETVKDFGLEVKASGGIKTYDDAVKLIEAGAARLGTSSGAAIVKG
ncbi:MAG: deoxyribose-phosphate aldolase [Candidatus Gastranaerophilales bacterium]|nr:deoxyribose-phosphate aldolase [Candidatus Gastranaerophilales bacterium]